MSDKTLLTSDELFSAFGKKYSATTWGAQKYVGGSKVFADAESYRLLDDLARLMAENERLKKSIDNYRSEWETPVPDLTLRIRYRKELFATLKGEPK